MCQDELSHMRSAMEGSYEYDRDAGEGRVIFRCLGCGYVEKSDWMAPSELEGEFQFMLGQHWAGIHDESVWHW